MPLSETLAMFDAILPLPIIKSALVIDELTQNYFSLSEFALISANRARFSPFSVLFAHHKFSLVDLFFRGIDYLAVAVRFVVEEVSPIKTAVRQGLDPYSLTNFSADNPLTIVSIAFITVDFWTLFNFFLRDWHVFLDLWLAVHDIFHIWVGKVTLADRRFGLSLHFFQRIRAGLLFVRGIESTHSGGSLRCMLEYKP